MIYEKSCGAVIIRKPKKDWLYLLLKYKKEDNYWGLAKGHVHKGESEIATATREIYEETGINQLFFVPDFRVTTTYSPAPRISKLVVFFLALTDQINTQSLCGEHNDFLWLDYEKAIKQIKFDNDRIVLKKAQQFIANHLKYDLIELK